MEHQSRVTRASKVRTATEMGSNRSRTKTSLVGWRTSLSLMYPQKSLRSKGNSTSMLSSKKKRKQARKMGRARKEGKVLL